MKDRYNRYATVISMFFVFAPIAWWSSAAMYIRRIVWAFVSFIGQLRRSVHSWDPSKIRPDPPSL